MADKPYGDVEYADPEDGKYPIDTAEHARAAWSYVNMPKNAALLGDKLSAVKARIVAACKKFGIDVADHASRSLEGDTIERRSVVMPVELRAINGAEASRAIGGYAAVFNRDSRMIPRGMGSSFIESLVPTFFEEARAAGWPGNQGSGVMCRYNHSDMHLLGTTTAGTCELNIDRTGLEYRIPEVPRCRDDVLELTIRGDCNRSSFTFMDAEDEWSYSDGVTHRTLISGGVLDVAPVSAVAGYQDTTVGMRSLARHMDAPFEDVFALAQRDELRQLFVRTDQAPVSEGRSAEQLSLAIGDGKADEDVAKTLTGRQVDISMLLSAIKTLTLPESPPPPPVEPIDPAEPKADAEPAGTPPLESEPPATLSWQEAHLQLLSRRPYDPIIK